MTDDTDDIEDTSLLSARKDQYAREDEIYRLHMMGKSPLEIANILHIEIRLVSDFIQKHFNNR